MDHKNALGPLLGCVSHLARERMDARASQYDITPAQTHVLLYLHHHGGRAAQNEVTEHLRVKPSTANGILDRMVEKGLVTRTVSDSDARRRLITLTDKGRERKQQLNQVFLDTEEMMARDFTPEEQETLRVLLGRVMQNLEEDRTV